MSAYHDADDVDQPCGWYRNCAEFAPVQLEFCNDTIDREISSAYTWMGSLTGVERTMTRSRRTENLLATLSVAAGAMATATGADAAVVATTGLHVFIGNTGPSSSSANTYFAVGTFSQAISIFAYKGATSGSVVLHGRDASLLSSSGLVVPQAAGTKWSSAGGNLDTKGGELNLVRYRGTLQPAGPESTKLYFDFRAPNASLSKTFYGWFAGSITGSTASNVGFTLNSYAYDNTGAELGAGDTGSSPVPEPSSIGLLALAAMATGAAGTRRLKRARAA